MRVVIAGKGGREHALAKKIQSSPLVTGLWVCPGNPGMAQDGLNCVDAESAEAIEDFCLKNKIALLIVGPEALILSDLKLRLEAQGILCFAPGKGVAEIESSKLFCKGILRAAQVPTARCVTAYSESEAMNFIRAHDFSTPLVLKADGLAQGKGVWVCERQQKAQAGVLSLGTQFGFPLLIEECLIGKELSAFALCDGKDFVLLGTACDYKRITADPFSANTGGMGAYSPCDFITEEDEQKIREIFSKTLNCLNAKRMPYQGFLFAGLMKTEKGLFVLEYNVRLGDPETQALLPRVQSDLLRLIVLAVTHELKNQTCEVSPEVSVHVVAASAGYPMPQMQLGQPLTYPAFKELKSNLYFAGVSQGKGHLVNSGGRVLGLTAMAATKEQARALAYNDLQKISFKGMYAREDIGL